MKQWIFPYGNFVFLGFLAVILQTPIIAQTDEPRSWPEIPKPATNDPYFPTNKMSQEGLGGIKFLSRTKRWEVDVAPTYLRDKALDFLGLPIGSNGRFATIARGGKEGTGFSVFGFKRVNSELSATQQVFYNTESVSSCYAPQFSPDGKSMVFRVGYPPDDLRNSFYLMLWDLPKAELRIPAPDAPTDYPSSGQIGRYFPAIQWSPGSRYIGSLVGGDVTGGYFDRLGNPYSSDGYSLYVYDAKTHERERRLSANAGQSWSWTNNGKVLFSKVTTEQSGLLKQRLARPSIYEMGVNDAQPKKLFDGGYFAHQSPNGEWIAFVDWPGPSFTSLAKPEDLLKNPDSRPNTKEEAEVQAGLYLFNRPSGRRVFVGPLQDIKRPVQMQWAPDGQTLYIAESFVSDGKIQGAVQRMTLEQQQLKPLSVITATDPLSTNNISDTNWLTLRSTSPDGLYLYANRDEYYDGGPKRYVNTQHTYFAINTSNGETTEMAGLTNIVNENIDWDFHDDSGVNPAFAAAQKIENALPDLGVSPTKTKR